MNARSQHRQADLFENAPALPAGFRYQPDLLSAEEAAALLPHVEALPFKAFAFHGFLGNRRTVSFGWHYDFAHAELRRAAEIPRFLLPIRDKAAHLAASEPRALQQVLVIEYRPGAGIGWHRDKAVFGTVVGISLGAPCVFRFRRKAGASWKRASFTAAPRSAYLLSGPSRSDWEHSIPPLDSLRYSLTFRTLRAD